MKGYRPETGGELFAEGYDERPGNSEDAPRTQKTVEVLADLAASGTVLELRERWTWWNRSPFTASTSEHVSVHGWAEAEA